MIKISPSALACDLTKMGEEVNEIEKAGAEMIHLDVMDGVFVPNSSFGLAVLESLRKKSSMFFLWIAQCSNRRCKTATC